MPPLALCPPVPRDSLSHMSFSSFPRLCHAGLLSVRLSCAARALLLVSYILVRDPGCPSEAIRRCHPRISKRSERPGGSMPRAPDPGAKTNLRGAWPLTCWPDARWGGAGRTRGSASYTALPCSEPPSNPPALGLGGRRGQPRATSGTWSTWSAVINLTSRGPGSSEAHPAGRMIGIGLRAREP